MSTDKLSLDICLSPKLIDNYDLTNTLVVIIDIVRASTTICTALSYGVDHILALDDVDEVHKLKADGYVTAGERNGEKLDGLDYGNSPISIMDRKLEGKKLAITTTNGTKTIKMALEVMNKFEGTELIVGAFVNYSILRRYLFSCTKNVLLVCSGWRNNLSIEDTIFAGKLADDLMKIGKYDSLTDSTNHAILIYENARANLFNSIMDYSVRFKTKAGQLSQDIRYCVKEDAANVLPAYRDGKFINIQK